MGWANCGLNSRGRSIGYIFQGKCDHKGCKERISRGLANACGGMHGTSILGGDDCLDGLQSCEGYFCGSHLRWANLEHEDGADVASPQLCFACASQLERDYRTEDYRSAWPTTALPLAIAIEARSGETGTGSTEGESAGLDEASPDMGPSHSTQDEGAGS